MGFGFVKDNIGEGQSSFSFQGQMVALPQLLRQFRICCLQFVQCLVEVLDTTHLIKGTMSSYNSMQQKYALIIG